MLALSGDEEQVTEVWSPMFFLTPHFTLHLLNSAIAGVLLGFIRLWTACSRATKCFTQPVFTTCYSLTPVKRL